MNNKSIIHYCCILLLILAPVAVVSCGGGDGGGKTGIIYARGSDSNKLDPHDVSDGESVKVIDQIYETLVEFPEDPKDDLKPGLAVDWKHSEDGTEWVFKLRENVTFHDGSSFEASDVVFNFNRLMNPGDHKLNGPYAKYYSNIESVKALDKTTVQFTLKNRSAVFLRNLAMFAASIVNPEAVKKHGETFGSQPSGTGPFRFRTWDRGERIVLERYEDYWGDNARSRRAIFIPVKKNEQRTQKLLTGGAHIIDGIGLQNIEQIKQNKNTKLLTKPGMNMGYMAMNTNHPPLNNPTVRKAIAYGINRKRILEDQFRGYGEPAETPLPPTIWGHHGDLERYNHDPEKARRLLNSADINLDAELTFLHMNNPRDYMKDPAEVARKIKSDLEEIGFSNITLQMKDWESYIQAVQNGEHDFCLLGWTTDNGDPDNFLSALFHSKNAEVGSANNVSFFQNEEYDQLVDRAKRELDREKREELYRDAQELLHDLVPVLPLAYMPQMAAIRKNVKGFEVFSIGEVRLKDVSLE